MKRVFPVIVCLLSLFALSLNAQTVGTDKSSLSFTALLGGSAVTQPLTITSSGASIPFGATVSSTFPWLKVNGVSAVSGNTPATINVSADPAGLTAGTYTGGIAITGFGNPASSTAVQVTFVVTTIGVSQQSLALPYQIGGSVPSPVAITLTGPATTFVATSSTTTGGQWLQLSGASGAATSVSGSSPGTLTVVPASIISGLAAGTYSGNINIAPAGAPPFNIPVTLTVSPAPPITFSTTAPVLYFQIGGVNNQTQQTIQLTTASTAPVTYLVGAPTVDPNPAGRVWFTASTTTSSFTAATPGVINVNVDPTGLTENLSGYNGSFVVQTSGVPATQTINVKLVVSNSPLITNATGSLNFTYQLGTATPSSQNIKIISTSVATTATTGQIPLTIAVAAGAPWLSAPASSTTGANIPVSVNPSGLAPGKYTSSITITGTGAANGPLTIPVTLTITNDPIIVATVNGCSTLTNQSCPILFPAQLGQNTPAQRIQLTASGGTALSYVATASSTACGGNWLTLGETTTGTTNGTFTASINTTGIAAGTQCAGTISIAATNPATNTATPNSPLTIPVTLSVSSGPQLVVTPTAVSFTAQQGGNSAQGVNCQGANPAFCTINVSSTSASASEQLTFTVGFTPNSGGAWLLVPPGSFTTAAGTATAVTVSANPTLLSAGTYTGTLTVTATSPAGVQDSPISIPVTLQVSAATLSVTPASLSFTQPAGGAAPAAKTIDVTSSGAALSYTVVAANSGSTQWLSITQASASGTTPGTITVNVDGSKLTPNTYTGTVTIVSSTPSTAGSPAIVNVTLTVTPGTISADKTSLTFTQAAGGAAPAAQTIAVTGAPSALNFTVTSNTENNGTWLKAPTASGTSTPATVTVSVDAASLPVGSYKGNVVITSTGATGSPITIPVTLNVVAAQTLTLNPTTVNFTYMVGLPAPQAQQVQVTSSGGNTTFNAQASSNATWLKVSPASGNVPGSFAISVDPTGLTTAGNLSGTVTVTSPAAAAPATVTVNLAVQIVPPPSITSLANAASYAAGGVSPGENIVIFGTGIGPAGTPVTGTVTGGVVDNKISDTQVTFDGTPAPIIYVSATQTSVMVPYEVAGRPTTTVRAIYKGVAGSPVTYNVLPAAPGIYTLNQQGNGPGAILNQDFSGNTPAHPEKKGNVVAIYMTGEGVIAGNVTGAIATTVKNLPVLPTATIGGVTARVLFAGTSPGIVNGVLQANVEIPLTAPSGEQPLVLTFGNSPTQAGVTVSVAP